MSPILEAAAAHCDIRERLPLVKPEWMVRGVWFAMARDEVKRRGSELYAAFEQDVGQYDAVTFKMYPVADYLRRLVVAGAVVASPERVHEGMRDIFLGSHHYFAKSLLGRAFVSLVRPTPLQLLKQVERGRNHIANYGQQRVEVVSDRHVRVHITGEPIYIESAMVGGFLSVFDVCGISGSVSVEMHSIFDGTLSAEW